MVDVDEKPFFDMAPEDLEKELEETEPVDGTVLTLSAVDPDNEDDTLLGGAAPDQATTFALD